MEKTCVQTFMHILVQYTKRLGTSDDLNRIMAFCALYGETPSSLTPKSNKFEITRHHIITRLKIVFI